jgi:hypothetical protein
MTVIFIDLVGSAGLEHFQVKWTRFTVENAARTKTRADSTQVKTALGPKVRLARIPARSISDPACR